uniref:Uncharacterized protein n=1 Tax=Anguilla anguilla TaxID=7936 RepID=A0A0E9US13_ANGAN
MLRNGIQRHTYFQKKHFYKKYMKSFQIIY